MRKVALITTGGTIAMVETMNGLSPTKQGEELVKTFGIKKFGIEKVEIKNLMNKDSSNISWSDRVIIGEEVAKLLRRKDIAGVVITHGTDTMIHTAHMLDYGLKGINKPVILTGAALPYDNPKSDGPQNLLDSIIMAAKADMATVALCVKGYVYKPENLQEISLYDLEKAEEIFFPKGRKRLAKINKSGIIFNPLAINESGSKKEGPPLVYRGHGKNQNKHLYNLLSNLKIPKKIIFDGRFDVRGVYVMSEAENSPTIFEEGIKNKHIKGLVIKGWGAGHVPMKGEDSWKNLLASCQKKGIPVVMCTKYGGPVSPAYEIGREIEKYGVIPSGDWTAEVAKHRVGFLNGHDDLITKTAEKFGISKHKLWKQLYIGGALFRNLKEEEDFEKKNSVSTHFDMLSGRFLFEDAVNAAAEYVQNN